MTLQEQNIFTLFLSLLQVKHTKKYSTQYYEEHPHNNNLYGLSQMLSHYKVENAGFKLNPTIEALQEIEAPFLVQTKEGFGIVSDINTDQIEIYLQRKKLAISFTDFLSLWTGILLVADPDDKSIEPEYSTNRKKIIFSLAKKSLLGLMAILLLSFVGYHTTFFKECGLVTSLLLNGTGLYICYLLLLKQVKIHSSHADKMCSLLLHQNDCNPILESDAAKIMGVSWSEIGAGYFIFNIILTVCLPTLIPFMAIINICCLPFTLWSVWYQYNAKQWCALCLLVQIIIWILFLNNLFFGLVAFPQLTVLNILPVVCLLSLPILVINLITNNLSNATKMTETTQKLNSLKADEHIFLNLLLSQERYPLNPTIGILIGKTDAKNIITVVSNPHCNPCAQLHPRLEDLLNKTDNNYCIQYILTSFNEELEQSSRLLIAMYRQMSPELYIDFLNNWYKEGKNNKETWYKKYSFDPEDKNIQNEMIRQKEWVKNAAIFSTPTILFNGYTLPDKYKVEDLIYFHNIDPQKQ